MTKWDKILIAMIILISLLSVGLITYNKSQAEALYGIIEVNGEEQERINLLEVDKSYSIKIDNGDEYNIVQVQKGNMRFIEATCPDGDCIRIGKLDAPGEVSVCLPNNVVIRVTSPTINPDGVDGTTY